jgi:prophage regulatory protein
MEKYIELSKKCLKEKLLRIKQVQDRTSLSKSYIYQLCSQNQFPKSIQLVAGGSSVAWIESEIQDWINSRIKARDEGGK